MHIDVFHTGSTITARPPHRNDHLTFHRSDDANRVQDIITAISFVTNTSPSLIQLDGDAHARGWYLAAAAISPVPVKTTAETRRIGSFHASNLLEA